MVRFGTHNQSSSCISVCVILGPGGTDGAPWGQWAPFSDTAPSWREAAAGLAMSQLLLGLLAQLLHPGRGRTCSSWGGSRACSNSGPWSPPSAALAPGSEARSAPWWRTGLAAGQQNTKLEAEAGEIGPSSPFSWVSAHPYTFLQVLATPSLLVCFFLGRCLADFQASLPTGKQQP